MIVDYFNMNSLIGYPIETYAPLIIDTNTILTRAVTFKLLQFIAWHRSDVLKVLRLIQVQQFSPGRFFQR
jgi:hypothetical protein